MTIRDKVTAFRLSFCCAILDAIRREEPPKSARWNAVNNVEERFQKLLDMYRAEKWQSEDLEKASELFNSMERKIARLFTGAKKATKEEACDAPIAAPSTITIKAKARTRGRGTATAPACATSPTSGRLWELDRRT